MQMYIELDRTVHKHRICRVGQNRIYAPYLTVYMVISLPKIPYIHHIYMVLANPTYMTMYGMFPTGYIVCVRSQWIYHTRAQGTVFTVFINGSGQPCVHFKLRIYKKG
jgi:hypothetical protein